VQIGKDLIHAKNIKQVAGYLFGPPGWSDDGTRLTVEQMRVQAKKK
jgi:hypothetical protein